MIPKKDREFMIKMTKQMSVLEKRMDHFDDELVVIKREKAIGDEKPLTSVSPSINMSAPVFPKVEGDPYCIVTSTFNLEGQDPVSTVMNQSTIQQEIRSHVIEFCRKNKIIGMSITFQEKQ